MSRCEVIHGDCVEVMAWLPAASVDACVTDPPYGLAFMGTDWDTPRMLGHIPSGVSGNGGLKYGQGTNSRGYADHDAAKFQAWCMGWAAAALRVLKPGGYMLAMGGTRTYHRLAVAVEDAGFEIRDCLMWLYGSGFPKGKGCLKPAYEPILLCRRPGPKVLPLGIDACRVGTTKDIPFGRASDSRPGGREDWRMSAPADDSDGRNPNLGRWPANLAHDGSDEVLEAFAAFGERKAGMAIRQNGASGFSGGLYKGGELGAGDDFGYADTGTAARFFYTAKASKRERGEGNNHPTVKPLALFRWLVKLVTPPGGLILDPFGGSGTTGKAAALEGFRSVLIEKEAAYVDIARRRIAEAEAELFAETPA